MPLCQEDAPLVGLLRGPHPEVMRHDPLHMGLLKEPENVGARFLPPPELRMASAIMRSICFSMRAVSCSRIASLTVKAVDLADDLLVIANHGFETGQSVNREISAALSFQLIEARSGQILAARQSSYSGARPRTRPPTRFTFTGRGPNAVSTTRTSRSALTTMTMRFLSARCDSVKRIK